MTHPLEVVKILSHFRPDEDTVIAALLHESLDQSKLAPEEIERAFGRDVAELVFSVEKMGNVRSRDSDAENVRSLFLSIAKDLRAVLIKLADRLHNMETLQFLPPEKQKRIARETLEMYAPIASRLGIYSMKQRLEDSAFMYLYPHEYCMISDELTIFGQTQHDVIASIKLILERFFSENGVNAGIDGRFKSVYSIYRKLKRKNKTSVRDLFDIFAMRVILPTVMKGDQEATEHLYSTLGLIHSRFTPLANRFKDYVAVPKPNGYQSLHTTVLGLAPKSYNHPVEVQIRSEKMHEEAEFGVAAHWLYKEMPAHAYETENGAERFMPHRAWLKGIQTLQKDIFEDTDTLEQIKTDLLTDRIFVLTPQGHVKDLPKDATPIDFAYSIHSDIGHRCATAKVNGSAVPLNHPLKNGDVVEIVLKSKPSPSSQWLAFVKTARAREKIRFFFKSQDRERLFKEGRELLNRQLARFGKPLLDEEMTLLKQYDDKRLTLQERRTLVEEIGMGSQLATNVVRKVFPESELMQKVEKEAIAPHAKTSEMQILLAGEAGLPVRKAKCCEPKEGEPIAGYITRGDFASVHRIDCRMLLSANPSRVLLASWAPIKHSVKYRVHVAIRAVDRIGLIRDISSAIADMNVNILDFVLRSRNDGFVTRILTLEFSDSSQIDELFVRCEQIKGVTEVTKETITDDPRGA